MWQDHIAQAARRPDIDCDGTCEMPAQADHHRVVEDWRGVPVETLADLVPTEVRIVCVGINPAPASVAVGHYYQGQLGQRTWRRFQQAGLLPRHFDGYEDDAAVRLGIGFTDIVKKPTRSAGDLNEADYAHGLPLLRQKLDAWQPSLVLFSFKKAAEKCFGKFDGGGFMPGRVLAGAPAFVMPSPYAAREQVDQQLAELSALVR